MVKNTRLNIFINLDFQRFEFDAKFLQDANFHFNLEKVEIFEAYIISTKKTTLSHR